MKEIPDGWVRMSAYDAREDKSSGGPTGDYRRLLAASKKNPPEFGVQNVRGLYGTLVKKDEADAYLQRISTPAGASPVARKTEPATQELLGRITVLCELVERLIETLT